MRINNFRVLLPVIVIGLNIHQTLKNYDGTLNQQLTPPYCPFCHVFVPVVSLDIHLHIHALLFFLSKVRLLIEINSTIDVENVTIALCKDLKLFLDINVCVGAVHEYKVNSIYPF